MNQPPPPSPEPAKPSEPSADPVAPALEQQIVEQADPNQLQHFVTTIKSAEQQVGENIISALHHEDTVAVLTTVVVGPDGHQRVVSAALDPKTMTQVQQLLTAAAKQREDEEKCVGFHCLVKRKVQLEQAGD